MESLAWAGSPGCVQAATGVATIVKDKLPEALSVNGLSDLFQLFVFGSILVSALLHAAKGLASWWDDWVHMPSNVAYLKTDVANLKTDVARLGSRTAWLSFLDK